MSTLAVSDAVDVAVLTVIPAELSAARWALGIPYGASTKDPDGTVYAHAVLRSQRAQRDASLVLACIGAAGETAASAATANLIARFRPRAVLLVGIAAGVRGKIRIGDVMLAERIVAYEPAALARTAGGAVVQPRPEIERLSHGMLQDVTSYLSDPRRLREVVRKAVGGAPRAPEGKEKAFEEHVAAEVAVSLGTIASGEKLLRDPDKLATLRATMHGKIEAGEMEAAGVVEACRRANTPWLVIRGISDFGDELKDDRFHSYAARAAAAVLVDFVAHGLSFPGAVEMEKQVALCPHDRGGPAGPNPFIFGRPVDQDTDFFGRENEKQWILDAIEKGQPVQIVGENLMGKTSLLRWVQRHVQPDRPAVLVDPTRGLTPVSMVRAIAVALDKVDVVARLDTAGASVQDAARALDAIMPLVLLVDDADALASLGEGFTDGFFGVLRSYVQSRRVTWVSASRRNLYELFATRGLPSEFLNDAKKIWLGLLDKRAARSLAARGAAAHVDKLLQEAGGFAYGVQWLGDYLYRRPRDAERAGDAFRDEAHPLFQRWWRGLETEEQHWLRLCAGEGEEVAKLSNKKRRKLRRLVDKGLVVEREGRFVVEGEAWREFVGDAG